MPKPNTPEEIAVICRAAGAAAPLFASISSAKRSEFLEAIAHRLEERSGEILEAASRETHLPSTPRLSGELARTCAQLRMFAELIKTDVWRDVRIVPGDPTREPIPKPELRRTQVPLGPVAVFGASNFPLAYSVPGGDTASALAAGCPVVVKAHPAHPETSRLAGEAILQAAADMGLPPGTFDIVWGGTEEGTILVGDPHIEAVGFTGSLRAGRALFDLARARPRPIPVYAEMGSVNPVFLLPGALDTKSDAIFKGFVESVTASVGQFCTNPGVVVGIDGPQLAGFVDSVATSLSTIAPQTMLTEGIASTYRSAVTQRSGEPGVSSPCQSDSTSPALFTVSAKDFVANQRLHEEIFGPSAIAVICEDFAEMLSVADSVVGQLTATVHFDERDRPEVSRLLPRLVRVAGRVIANGFPTGVEVNAAQTHGGPYPATTDSRSTSVGTAAILRFVRPITFQNFPADLLPSELV